jgi:hypothetical protein
VARRHPVRSTKQRLEQRRPRCRRRSEWAGAASRRPSTYLALDQLDPQHLLQVPLLGHCDALLLALHVLTAAYCGAELLVSRYVGELLPPPLLPLPGRTAAALLREPRGMGGWRQHVAEPAVPAPLGRAPVHRRRADRDLEVGYFTYFTNWTLMLLSLAGLVAFANVARHMWRRERGGRALVAGGLGAAARAHKALLDGAPPARWAGAGGSPAAARGGPQPLSAH